MSRVVVAGELPESALSALDGHDVVWWQEPRPMPREELLARVPGADAIVAMLDTKVDDELLDAAGDQLKVVANVAVGYDNIDLEACERHGVVATNTPAVLVDATADIAFGLILMVTRRLGESERLIRRGDAWKWGMTFQLGMGLQGKTIGIVGAGDIGMAVARRARAFGMDIVYTRRSALPPEGAGELGARRVELDELLRVSDVVSLHLPLVAKGRPGSTWHLIDADALAAMKPTAYLVNTARGPVVDEAALAAALRDGVIAGAGLDVYENEPAVDPALIDLDNVVLLPHLGSATTETRSTMVDLAARNIDGVLSGSGALTPVTG